MKIRQAFYEYLTEFATKHKWETSVVAWGRLVHGSKADAWVVFGETAIKVEINETWNAHSIELCRPDSIDTLEVILLSEL